jgi:hypothetical protein
MKFLVVWKMEISRLSAEMMKTVLRMPDYAKPLEEAARWSAATTSWAIMVGHGSLTWSPTMSWRCCWRGHPSTISRTLTSIPWLICRPCRWSRPSSNNNLRSSLVSPHIGML